MNVLHCSCFERVTLLVWQTCNAACAVLRTLMWCSRTRGPCNSLMPFSWSQNSTENTKPNTNTKASYIEDILMQWSWKPFSIKYHTLQLSDVLVLAVTWWSETNRLVIKSWTLRAAALVFRMEEFQIMAFQHWRVEKYYLTDGIRLRCDILLKYILCSRSDNIVASIPLNSGEISQSVKISQWTHWHDIPLKCVPSPLCSLIEAIEGRWEKYHC